MKIVPASRFVAAQKVQGLEASSFLKLARPYTLQEVLELPRSNEPHLPFDAVWLISHGFDREMVRMHCATSCIVAVEEAKYGVVLVKTNNSVYQLIPDFS